MYVCVCVCVASGGAVGWSTTLQAGEPDGVIGIFFIGIILPADLRPWGWLSL